MLLALAAGLGLRLMFMLLFPGLEDDSLVYGGIAKNLVLHGDYALNAPVYHLTLIRLPGYPLFVAALFRVFGVDRYGAVLGAQVAFDLAACLLVAGFARDWMGTRVGLWALWVAALCPFTANYVALPMTETLSIFCVSLALFAAGRVVARLLQGVRAWGYGALLGGALGAAVLLRPDGALLGVAVLPAVLWYGRRAGGRAVLAVLGCGLLALAPLVPWAVRNEVRFHVFEPLAPRFATDPGVFVPVGYVRWTKTWFAEFASNEEVYWDGNETTMHPEFLPGRAFDSAEQRGRTLGLIAAYNAGCRPGPAVAAGEDPSAAVCRMTPAEDRGFAQLADERLAAHPVRRGLGLAVVRVLDMWLRPRVEYLPVKLEWWKAGDDVWESVFAAVYGGLNLALLVCAGYGFARGRLPLAGMMLGYVGLRCVLLLTLENAEPRYTLECFPMLFVAAAGFWVGGHGLVSVSERRDGNPLGG